MRDIAKSVGISVATLYHHFPDKDSLYLGTVQYAYTDKLSRSRLALQADGAPESRFKGFIRTLVEFLGADPDFRRLLQWELLDGDDHRHFAHRCEPVQPRASTFPPRDHDDDLIRP